MSGSISPQIAQAAAAHALRAEAQARGVPERIIITERARAVAASKAGKEPDSLAGAAWRGMHMRVRTLLVMLEAQDAQGDPRAIALQPWGSFSAADQLRMGAAAREIRRELGRADYLR